jgi:2'-5' RNA ligase
MPPHPPRKDRAAPATARLFVALWPDDALRQALTDWAAPWTGSRPCRPVAASQLHLTLHFLGNVPRELLPALKAALRLPAPPCELRIGGCARWRDVLVALPLEVPPALQERQARLGAALHALGLPLEAREWRPHVTLARRHEGPLPPPPAGPLRWPVHGHVLAESAGGYRVLERFGPAPGG